MNDAQRPVSVTVNDPASMRALAHPLRLKLLGLLRLDGPASVGALAQKTGEAPGSISYHIGTLARSGFVVEAPELARDGRERWWRAAHEVTHFEPAELREDPEQHGASLAMRQAILQAYLAEQLASLDAEAALDRDWLAASGTGDVFAHLTLDEFRELSSSLEALIDHWAEVGREPRDGTRPVRAIVSAFPRP